MIFRDFPLDAAQGTLLAHTHRLATRVLPKGTVLDRASVLDLHRAGLTHVAAARLDEGDVPEDIAAGRLADALLGPGMRRTRAGSGRANLAAAHDGLFRADPKAVDAINLLHEGLTIATLPDATKVAAGDILATVKIIPFAIAGEVLAEAESLARAQTPLRLPGLRPLRTGLVVTILAGVKESIYRNTVAVTEGRIAALSGSLLPPLLVPHAQDPIADAIRFLSAEGAEVLLIAGASATVDRGDAAPAAIVAAGGSILHFGMPVDPGNLICLGRLGTVPVLVLPGCARSPALNGIDLMLMRIFAGEPAGAAEIARMGVGGLLKNFAARPAPRSAHERQPPRVAAVVLAAGLSSRMAPDNKLLIPDHTGRPMIARVLAETNASQAAQTVLVLGHQAEQVAAAADGLASTMIHAPHYETGLAASLRAGIAALPAETDAAIICLGDMPLVTADMIDEILQAYDPEEGRAIIVPTYHGKRGNPVLWGRRFFPEIMALAGDTGARSLLMRHAEHVAELEVGSDAVLTDFDTPETLARLAQ